MQPFRTDADRLPQRLTLAGSGVVVVGAGAFVPVARVPSVCQTSSTATSEIGSSQALCGNDQVTLVYPVVDESRPVPDERGLGMALDTSRFRR